MSVKNIMIFNLNPQYTAQYIALALWRAEIAMVSSITLIPEIKNDMISNIAYINIESFCDTEAASHFVRTMAMTGDYIFIHEESDPENSTWVLQKNTHNSGNLYVGSYTTIFMSDFFRYQQVEAESEFIGINDEDSESLPKITFGNKLQYARIHPENSDSRREVALSVEEFETLSRPLNLNQSPPAREVAGEWYNNHQRDDLINEVFNFANRVQEAPTNSRHEVALSAEEFEALEIAQNPTLPLRREEGLTDDEIKNLLNSR